MGTTLQDTFRKRFIAASSDSLVIETTQTISKTKRQKLRVLKLKGAWRANSQNELCFDVTARKGPPQTYTFKGAWKINKNQQIEYVWGAGADVLNFKGHWDISSANKLVYILEGSSISRFEFKAQLESASMYAKEGRIRYRIGIGAKKNRFSGSSQIISLYGEWKFGKGLGLIFKMDYGRNKIKEINFGAEAKFGRNEVAFALKDQAGKPLGITLTMTHNFLEHLDAEAFIRLKARKDEYGAEAGINIPF